MTKREALGTALVGVGVIGVALPIIPGFPFLLAAVAVLGPDHRLTRPINGLLQRGRAALGAVRASLGLAASAPEVSDVSTIVPASTPEATSAPARGRRARRPLLNGDATAAAPIAARPRKRAADGAGPGARRRTNRSSNPEGA
jgi:hypothetical protein